MTTKTKADRHPDYVRFPVGHPLHETAAARSHRIEQRERTAARILNQAFENDPPAPRHDTGPDGVELPVDLEAPQRSTLKPPKG